MKAYNDYIACRMSEGDNDTCLELALEGEKLCKSGKCRDGVAFFEAALQSGTDDFRQELVGGVVFYCTPLHDRKKRAKKVLSLRNYLFDELQLEAFLHIMQNNMVNGGGRWGKN